MTNRTSSRISWPRTMLIALLLAAAPAMQAAAQGASKPGATQDFSHETTAQRDARMAWWRDAQFGMFIHWGAYAVPAGTYNGERVGSIGEWIMNRGHIPIAEYEKFARAFNPVKYDADEWVRIAKDAGMKYIIITSKHHDGFSMYDSKVSNYDIVHASPYHRDAVKALADAAHRQGMKFGVYYSIMDWHHPDAQAPEAPAFASNKFSNPNFGRYVDNYMKPQLRELLTQYPNIDVLWFDGDWVADWNEDRGRDLYNYVRSIRREQPRGPCARRHERNEQGGAGGARRFRHAGAARAAGGTSGRRLGNVHDDERHLGLQELRRCLEGHAHAAAHADRCGGEGRKLSPQCGTYCGRGDSGGKRGAPARDGAVDARQRRVHLRHDREPLWSARLGALHGEGGNGVRARVRLAEGPRARPHRREGKAAGRVPPR